MAQEFFDVLRVSRDDFAAAGFDASELSDEEMERVASKMGDNECLMNAFWTVLRCYAEYNDMPRTQLTLDNTHISTWFERDRQSVILYDDRENEDKDDESPVLVEFWDEQVSELVEDGFLDPKDWHGSALEYYLNCL